MQIAVFTSFQSGSVQVNEGVTSGNQFMYNYFFEKMGQAQNVRKNYICEKGGVNSNFF